MLFSGGLRVVLRKTRVGSFWLHFVAGFLFGLIGFRLVVFFT